MHRMQMSIRVFLVPVVSHVGVLRQHQFSEQCPERWIDIGRIDDWIDESGEVLGIEDAAFDQRKNLRGDTTVDLYAFA